jgi:hypothetical protein
VSGIALVEELKYFTAKQRPGAVTAALRGLVYGVADDTLLLSKLIGLRTGRSPRNGVTLRCGCWHYGMVGQTVTAEGERLGGWNSNECPTHGRQPIVQANVAEWDPTPTCEASKAVAAEQDVE